MGKDEFLSSETYNHEAEELVKRTEVQETPFTIIETDGQVFGTLGKFRLTEPLEATEENKSIIFDELRTFTWNRVLQLIICVFQEQETITNLLKEEDQ